MQLQDRSHLLNLLRPDIYIRSHSAVMFFAVLIAVAAYLVFTVQVYGAVAADNSAYNQTGRNSSTEFTIQNSAANGGTPGNTNITFGSTSIAIYRAFNTLSAAIANSDDSNHMNLTSGDLFTPNYQLDWTCYKDTVMDDGYFAIDGYTTGADNYIRFYTPVASSEVGAGQRHNGTAGIRYYYAVTSLDSSVYEDQSVMSEAVSVVLSTPVTSLAGSGGGSGGGGGGCFISTSQGAFNQDIMNGLAFLGVVVILWRLIMKIKSRGRRAGRRSSAHRGANSVFDETTDLGFRVMTEKGNLVVAGTDDRAGQEKQASDLPEEPPAIVDSSPY